MKAKFVNIINEVEHTHYMHDANYKPIQGFSQLCVWPGTLVGKDNIEDFEDFFKNEMGVRVKFMEEVKTLPGDGGEGGRNDVLFYIHDEDVGKFAVPRLRMGIRWWEDVLDNEKDKLYPQEIYKKYPKTW